MSSREWFSGLSVAANILATTACVVLATNLESDETSQAAAIVTVVSSLASSFFCLLASHGRRSIFTGLNIGLNIATSVLVVAAATVDEGDHIRAGLALGASLLSMFGAILGVCQARENREHDDYVILV